VGNMIIATDFLTVPTRAFGNMASVCFLMVATQLTFDNWHWQCFSCLL